MVRVAYPIELVKVQESTPPHTQNNPQIIISGGDIKALERFILGLVAGIIIGLLIAYALKK